MRLYALCMALPVIVLLPLGTLALTGKLSGRLIWNTTATLLLIFGLSGLGLGSFTSVLLIVLSVAAFKFGHGSNLKEAPSDPVTITPEILKAPFALWLLFWTVIGWLWRVAFYEKSAWECTQTVLTSLIDTQVHASEIALPITLRSNHFFIPVVAALVGIYCIALYISKCPAWLCWAQLLSATQCFAAWFEPDYFKYEILVARWHYITYSMFFFSITAVILSGIRLLCQRFDVLRAFWLA